MSRPEQVTMTAIVGHRGLRMREPVRMQDFIHRHAGRTVVVTITLLSEPPTAAMITYFARVLVPEFREAFYEHGENYTLEKTHDTILTFCPEAIEEKYDESSGRYLKRTKSLHQLTHAELSGVIDHLKQLLAEEFGRFVK